MRHDRFWSRAGRAYPAMKDKDYVRRLAELPGDWPPPEELGPR